MAMPWCYPPVEVERGVVVQKQARLRSSADGFWPTIRMSRSDDRPARPPSMDRADHTASPSARRLLVPYGASLLVVVGLLPVEARLDIAEVSAALALLVAAGAGLTAAALGHERRGTTLASLLS